MKKVFVLLSFILIIGLASAQPGGGGDPGGGEPVPLPGIGILLAAGALLGAGAFSKARKNEKSL